MRFQSLNLKLGDNYVDKHRVLEGKNRGAEVNIDIGHTSKGTPAAPHVGWQTPGKNNTVGHIFINSVDVNRSRVKLD